MIEVVIHACLALQPAMCVAAPLTFVENSVSTFACLMYGQLEIAKWRETHPDYVIKGWKCGIAGRYAKA